MKFIKVTLSVTALLLLVVVVAVSSLLIFIDPNKLKPVIAAELKKQTGYEAVIDGQFSWSFYPRLGIKVEHIALFVPKEKNAFVDLRNITFVTEIIQLLKGQQKLRGDIYISEVKLLNINARNAHVGMRWQNRELTLQPITASLYDGSLVGSAHGNGLTGTPRWDWGMQLSNVQLQPLLLDVNGADSKLQMSGVGQIKLFGHAEGKSRDQVLNSLNGVVSFNLDHGVVAGIDLNYLVRTADAILNKQQVTVPTAINQTEFDSLSGTATITNGVVSTNDVKLTSSALMASGAGSINLIYQAINLQLRVMPQKDMKTQWVVPVMITGNLSRPDVRLDVTELNVMVAKEKLDKVKSKVRDEIKRHVSGKTGEVLQNLLGK